MININLNNEKQQEKKIGAQKDKTKMNVTSYKSRSLLLLIVNTHKKSKNDCLNTK